MSTTSPDPRRWWALFLLATAQFIVILDTSIIGVALPSIQRALGFSPSDLQWVFNAYVIVFGGLVLLGGRLSDLLGHRRVFMLGFVVLSLASLLAGLAPSEGVLIAARALQGLGAAIIAPAALSIVMGLFTKPADIAKAFGIYGAAAPAGGTAGVFLGGVITQWLSWHWVFLINVPLGVLVLALSPALLQRGVARQGRVDVLGALAVTGALVLAVYAIVTANVTGWATPRTIGLFVLAALLLGVFLVIQQRRQDPLVPLRIFKAPNLSAGNLVMLLLGGAWIPMWFFLNLYLQQVLGYSALDGGLALLPMTVAIMLIMVGVTGRLIGAFGFKRNLAVGLPLLAGAMLLFTLTPPHGSFLLNVLPASLLAALGMGLSYIPALIAATSGARPEEAGLASGLVNTSYQVGSALGLAATVAISTALGVGGASHIDSLNAGFHGAFVGAAVVAGLGALVTVGWLRQPRQSSAAEEPSPESVGSAI